MSKSDWSAVCWTNVLAILIFFLLYNVFPFKPYSNMLFFLMMLLVGVYYAKKYSLYRLHCGFYKTLAWSVGGSVLMFFGYLALIYAHSIFSKYQELSQKADIEQWGRFVAPWLEINRVISILGIIVVVLATEFFYRAYLQALFENAFKSRWSALLLASLLSGVRGISGGKLAGPFDFTLSFLWGYIYMEGGLTAAFISHIVWDIFFVYFAR